MKILVVDDHALVREGLRQILGSIESDVVVLDAGTCAQAFEFAEQHSDLDLVLLDFHLPDMNGLDALDVFSKSYPELPVIMLSGSASPLMMQQVIKRGAAAFLTKSGNSEELLEVVSIILSGGVYDSIKGMASAFSANELAVLKASEKLQLTSRQEEVLQLLLDGCANKVIGQVLNLSEETVKNHVSGILRVFGVNSRTQAVLAAKGLGYRPSSRV
jgi:DNA-binding NarL/FixJ family response regulator